MRSAFVERMIDLGGTLRARDASWSLERVRPVLGRVGITRVANVTGLDHVGIPTWMVVRPLARSLTVSQGKGLNHSLAQISGIMESIEIHHAEHFVPVGFEAPLWASVQDDAYVSPLRLPIRSDAVFDVDTLCYWIEATDILSGRRRWLPREPLDLDFTARSKDGVFVSSSNGLASGNTQDEAILHGLCEVIERDQVAFWLVRQRSRSNLPSTRVDLETVDDADCRWLIERTAKAGLELVVWYATTNIPMPCFVCLVYDDKGNTYYQQRASGSGCHPYRRIALSRAITEALQSRLTHISGVRDDVYWSRYRRDLRMDEASTKRWIVEIRLELECVDFSEIPDACRLDTTGQMLCWIVEAIEVAGLAEIIVVDLTQHEIGLPVVHVTLPGLESNVRTPLYTPGKDANLFERAGYTMTTCLFAGPTLYQARISGGIDVFQPAMLGSVFRAVEAGYGRIGIVDGYFGNTPAVWHKEILYAMAQGAEVVGAGSTGALRAAELWRFGMVGIGTVFRLYRSGILRDDDEVCVVHATEEFDYRPLSIPMINIRYTLRQLRRFGYFDIEGEGILVAALKNQHFSRRTLGVLAAAVREFLDGRTATRVCEAFEYTYVDVKRRDALALVDILSKEPSSTRAPLEWEFPRTTHWVTQFEHYIADVPTLRSSGPLC